MNIAQKRIAILIASLITSTSAMAQMRAVEETNGEARMSFSGANFERAQWRSLGLDGRITIPISTYFAAALSGNASQTRANFESRANGNKDESCDLNSTSGELGVFFRDYDIGKIGVSYRRLRSQSCWIRTSIEGVVEERGKENNDSQAFSLYGDYYLNQWTLGADYTRNTPMNERWGKTVNDSYNAGATYYPMNNMAVRAGISHTQSKYESDWITVKTKNNTQSIGLEYQPALFGNTVSFGLGFSHQKNENQSSNAANITATWFFGKPADLITKDRRQR